MYSVRSHLLPRPVSRNLPLRRPLLEPRIRTRSIRSGALLARRRIGRAGLAQGHRDLARQLDGEDRTGPELGVALDRAAVALDELMHDREAEPRALADILGGEERVPDARQDVGRDALPVVADLDGDGVGVARGVDRDRRVVLAREGLGGV